MNGGTRGDSPDGANEKRRGITTQALEAAAKGRESLDDFVPELYEELRGLAHRQLRGERADHTLCTTALVHEAYLKLAKLDRLEWQNRAHFCAEAARAMRRILVDYAVRRGAKKRGGDRNRVERPSARASSRKASISSCVEKHL